MTSTRTGTWTEASLRWYVGLALGRGARVCWGNTRPSGDPACPCSRGLSEAVHREGPGPLVSPGPCSHGLSQAMHLVYRALEKEPVPAVLPPSLIPPAKRKKSVFAGAVPVLPASPPPRDSLRSTPSHGSVSSLNSAGSLSPKHSLKPAQVPCGSPPETPIATVTF